MKGKFEGNFFNVNVRYVIKHDNAFYSCTSLSEDSFKQYNQLNYYNIN